MRALFALLILLISAAASSEPPRKPPVSADAVFERIKHLAGSWKARSTKGWTERSTYRVIARGTAVLQDDSGPGMAMASVFVRDGDRVLLNHYCEAGNHPRLVASAADEGARTATFTFLDATNLASRDKGHMDKVVFRFLDDDHFDEQWTWYQDGKESWMEDIHYRRLQGEAAR